MIQTKFKDQLEFDVYIALKKTEMEKGYLTRSEREQLNKMLEKDYKPSIIKEEPKKTTKSLVTDYRILRRHCKKVTKEDNIEEIIKDLKDALDVYGGVGISANQIGINKRISYIRVPSVTEDKKVKIDEIILINPKIVERSRTYIYRGEGCTSFKDLFVNTDRYVFITVINHNQKLEEQTFLSQDFEAVVIQHEIDHQNGITIIERKHKK